MKKKIVCWKCKSDYQLYKVDNRWIFACAEHKDLPVPLQAYSMIEYEKSTNSQV